MDKSDRHLDCSICRGIPNQVDAFWKGNELSGNDLPRAESHLKVVGAPFFHDDQSHSHQCLKRCPECGTFYDWDYRYEFLVNGSEDEIILTRLSDQAGRKRVQQVLAMIQADEADFRAKAERHLQTLQQSVDGKGIYGAAYFLMGGQYRGHSIAFAIPALMHAFITFAVKGKESDYLRKSASLLYFVLSDAIKESARTAREVSDLLKAAAISPETEIRQFQWLIADCQKLLRSFDG